MKRRDLLKHLSIHGCVLKREGSKHSIYWDPNTRKRTSVPRHNEVDDATARGICKQLAIPDP
ncbi:MAG: type II toxin-antitoxin system HicA family toxin [Rubrobacteraceae bacterium]